MSAHHEAGDSEEADVLAPDLLSRLDDLTLLQLPYLAVAEARRRGLVATWDLPSGGYAERLAGLAPAITSFKEHG